MSQKLIGTGPRGKPLKVVIVEDKKMEASQIRQILESQGFQVIETFENGRDFMDWYEKNPREAQLIMLDLIMPVLDGYAVLWELKEKGGQMPPVVVSSVENSAGLVKSILALGALDFITRPLKRDPVIERMGRIVGRLQS